MPARREPAPRLPEACAAKYRVIRPLGRGGFGQVLLAEHRDLRRQVALKLLDPAMLDDPAQIQRFVEEARITAALSHPHIVVILDHGAGDGAPWIAYEFLEGGSLRDRLGRGGLNVRESLAVGIQSASALHQAHRQGILHRDVKPENLLLAQPGHWKVTDFGIAKWSRPGRVQTQSGLLIGTPLYLAPEQIQSLAPEPASDQYALGVVLYECLTGHPPFAQEEVGDLLRAHLQDTPSRPGAGRPDIPAALDEVVLRCLEKEPSRRFSTAAALEEALTECSALVPATTRARPVPGRSGRSAATAVARANSAREGAGAGHQALTEAAARSVPGQLRPASGLLRLLAALVAVAGLAAAGWWTLGSRETGPSAASAVSQAAGPARAQVLLERPDLGIFRRLSLRVRGATTIPVEVCVRCVSGWEARQKFAAGTQEVSFGPMNWADRCTLELLGPDLRPLGPSLIVTTPPLLTLSNLAVVPADELVVVAGLARARSLVEFTVESLTPPAQGFTRRARSNPQGFFREVLGGLRPDTRYRLRWQPSTGWVPSGDVFFETLGAEHGRLVRSAITLASLRTGSDPTAALPLLVQASISPDPRMTPSLLVALRSSSMATSTELGRFAGLAKKLMDPALAARLLELAPEVPALTVRMDLLDTATTIQLPQANPIALQALEEASRPEHLEACADLVCRAQTPEACDRVVRRLEREKPLPYVPVAVRAMLACNRERARGHLERWVAPANAREPFKFTLAVMGLRLIGDERAVALLGRLALETPEPWHRIEAADALGHCTVSAARAVAAKVLASAPANPAFLWMSVRLGAGQAMTAVRTLLLPGNSENDRRLATMVAGALGESADGKALRTLLAESSPLLAGAAALALSRLEGSAAGPALLEAMASGRDPSGLFSLALGTTRHPPAESALLARLDAALASHEPGRLGAAASVLCGLGALGTPGGTNGVARRLASGTVPEELRPLAETAMRAEKARQQGAQLFAASAHDVLLRTGLRLTYGERFALSAEGLVELATKDGGVGRPARPLRVLNSGRIVQAGASAFLGSQIVRVTPGSSEQLCTQEAELLLSPYDDEVTQVSPELPLEKLSGGVLFTLRRSR
jgi:serine/threonine-protein kinase